MKNLNDILLLHKKWLDGETDGKKADLRYADLSNADLSNANLSNADLSNADLSNTDLNGANLSNADLSNADLIGANLSNADLIGADLSNADLSNADLIGADLSEADLRSADLRGADLSNADLSNADLNGANLSNAVGILSSIDYLENNFEKTSEGYIAYKVFNGSYCCPKEWVIEKNSIISENINHNRTNICGCGINVAPLKWVKDNYNKEIWKVLIRWEWLAGVCVPYNTDGKIRCEKVQLLEVVS